MIKILFISDIERALNIRFPDDVTFHQVMAKLKTFRKKVSSHD
jgi:hypothetical protein